MVREFSVREKLLIAWYGMVPILIGIGMVCMSQAEELLTQPTPGVVLVVSIGVGVFGVAWWLLINGRRKMSMDAKLIVFALWSGLGTFMFVGWQWVPESGIHWTYWTLAYLFAASVISDAFAQDREESYE